MMPADKLLPQLSRVQQVKPKQWTALCPAHDDQTPSLRIVETADGTLLLKCWAGCTAAEIVEAVELTLRDLFPEDHQRPARRGPHRAAIDHERRIVVFGLLLLAQGAKLPLSDLERLETARRRLARLEGRK
ncbi:virulence-associated protein E [Metapseudomonas boanensis]|uniref:Virulence-associated protein E n=1 Tax=Metapseudomonas boanensis TaxID=2822138 RepID=A0ABS5XGL2_9GAMM|nr:virulence-associated protein E [Pseudomonas boanensis]MBT8766296.1 virulence-associated protein E [Pseudomonas boanensis]